MTSPSEPSPEAATEPSSPPAPREPRPLVLGFVLGVAAYMLAVPASARVALAFGALAEGGEPTAWQHLLSFLGSQLHVLVCAPLVVSLAGLTATQRSGRALAFAAAASTQLIPLTFLVAFEATARPFQFLPVFVLETGVGGLLGWAGWSAAQRLMRRRAEARRRRAEGAKTLATIDFEAIARAQRQTEGAAPPEAGGGAAQG